MKKKQLTLMTLCTALCVLSLAVMAAALLSKSPTQTTDFTPPPFDPAAQTGAPDVPDGLGYGEIDAKVFKASVCGVFAPAGGVVNLWLTNPESSSVWLKLRILDANGNILGETGIIRPGEYVRTVAVDNVPASGSNIVFKLMAYEPETYRSAGSVSLNTTVS